MAEEKKDNETVENPIQKQPLEKDKENEKDTTEVADKEELEEEGNINDFIEEESDEAESEEIE